MGADPEMATAVPDEVPVGDTSVVCFNYTLDGTLCEVPRAPPYPEGAPGVPPFTGRAKHPKRGTGGGSQQERHIRWSPNKQPASLTAS